MAKKRKRSSDAAAAVEKPDEFAPQRPERTLFGFKEKPADDEEAEAEPASEGEEDAAAAAAAAPFRNKEKVLVTCSRRINYR